MFRCDASSPLGPALSATSWLDVHLAPHFPSAHKEVMIMMTTMMMKMMCMMLFTLRHNSVHRDVSPSIFSFVQSY